MSRFINAELKSDSDSEPDSEPDSEVVESRSDTEWMAKLKCDSDNFYSHVFVDFECWLWTIFLKERAAASKKILTTASKIY